MKNWKEIKTEKDFIALIAKSEEKPQIIFKDSITCGISAHAKHRLDTGTDLLEEKADVHYLDLLSYREISSLIARQLNVTHQSPQIIILKNKKVVYHSSHSAIQPATMRKYLE